MAARAPGSPIFEILGVEVPVPARRAGSRQEQKLFPQGLGTWVGGFSLLCARWALPLSALELIWALQGCRGWSGEDSKRLSGG